MIYPVETFDYEKLIQQLGAMFWEHRFNEMMSLINETMGELTKDSEWNNEGVYFFHSLYNAARKESHVRIWLATQPHLRNWAPENVGSLFVDEVPLLPLPEIGGTNDKRRRDTISIERPKFTSALTEENFEAQLEFFKQLIEYPELYNMNFESKSIQEWVNNFRYSGTGKQMAATILTENGCYALGTPEGIAWLIKKVPKE